MLAKIAKFYENKIFYFINNSFTHIGIKMNEIEIFNVANTAVRLTYKWEKIPNFIKKGI